MKHQWILVALALTIPGNVCWGKPTLSYRFVEDRWNELASKYPDQGCVVVDKETEVTLKFSTNEELSTETRIEMILGILDLDKAPNCLEQTFDLFPGEKAKEITAWAHERGGSEVTYIKPSDVKVVTLFGDWKQVRVAVPGISHAGSCGIVLRTESNGPPPLIEHFASEYALETGEFRLCMPTVMSYGNYDAAAFFNETFHPVIKGNVTEAPPTVTREKGYTRTFRASDVPARPKGPLVLAEDLPVADLYLVPVRFTWKRALQNLYAALDKVDPPKQMLKAAKDTLAKTTDGEKISAISRYLDDPDNFQLVRPPRQFSLDGSSLAEVIQERRGDAFDKAILAYSLLRKLGTKCYVVFGSSQYIVKPDWRVFDPKFLTAVLLWVPGIDERFIWDIADRSVPIGWAGADLYPNMVVVSEDPDTQEFRISSQRSAQKRVIDWSLDTDGRMSGKLTWAFEGWPDPDMDPWQTQGADLKSLVEKACPSGIKVKQAAWSKADHGMRCSAQNPAVLIADLEAEAEPSGEAGWSFVPFRWPVPSYLSWAISNTKNAPIYFDHPQSVMDSVVITLPEGFSPASIPQILGSGKSFVHSAWQQDANKISATRTMSLPRLRLEAAGARDLNKVLDDWNACAEQKVTVVQP